MTRPDEAAPARLRREPPSFRRVEVRSHRMLTPRLVAVTFGGPELTGFTLELPAASVRLLLPTPGRDLEIPAWNGNEFLLADGTRPVLRTMTPLPPEPASPDALTVEMVVHGHGPASTWASTVATGQQAALSGPGRGYRIDAGAPAYVLAGDESALPAIRQLLEALPAATPTTVLIEIAAPNARLPLPERAGTTVSWLERAPDAPPGDALVAAVQALTIARGSAVWAAGEAASMQRIRRHLFEEVGLARADATVRGYWKVGRGGDAEG